MLPPRRMPYQVIVAGGNKGVNSSVLIVDGHCHRAYVRVRSAGRTGVESIDAVSTWLCNRRRSGRVGVARFASECGEAMPQLAHDRLVCPARREIPHLVRIILKVVELPLLGLLPEMNELPPARAHAPILPNTMLSGILVVLVEERVAPRDGRSDQQWREALAMHPAGNGQTRQLQKRRS